MELTDIEKKIIDNIEYVLNCGPNQLDDLYMYKSSSNIRVRITNSKDTTYRFEFLIHRNDHANDSLRLRLWEHEPEDNSWASRYEDHHSTIILTEEEYFQRSTVEKLLFSLEFYQYLDSVLQYKE
jgi:hypothetical protein